MNRSFIVAVLTVTMIIIMSATSHAAAPMHNFGCDNCHGRFIGGAGFVPAAKSCISCHNSMGEASRMPVDSMANYFGSVPGQPATGPRSTHTYLVSYSSANSNSSQSSKVIYYKSSKSNTLDIADAANIALNNTTQHNAQQQKGQVTCNRCHNAAGNTYTAPMLRATNANDALCFDCHRPRRSSSAALGSHPVDIDYLAVYGANTTAFRKVPLSGNSNNPTANPGNYLSSGKIVCTTCHAPHYADSNSATLDNRSTANGFAQDDPDKGLKGQLQNSKGQLLRNDPVGATAASINVCSSCHKETANLNHNAKGQNVQCDHCHGAHVDYTGDGSLPNWNLIRRDFSNISTDKKKPGNVKVLFNNNTGFKRADGKGICQICHALPTTVDAHNNPNSTNADCRGCHNHKNGFSAADCASCHGQPPMTSLVGGPDGKASASYTVDESLTPHATHANSAYYNYACKNCHYDGTLSGYHNTGTFSDVFIDPPSLAGKPKNVPGDYASKQCSNVYCHSNGDPRGDGVYTTVTTPPWEYGKNKIVGTATECNSCHNSGAALDTNAHNKHVSSGLSCNVCHVATASGSTAIADRTKHANGVKDVKFITRPANFFGVFSSSWNTATATCNNSCHSNGLGGAPAQSPVWTDRNSGECGDCHAKIATTSLHPFHFYSTAGPKLGANPDCASCHVYSNGAVTHANGMVDLKAGNSCAPCHPGVTSPIWATGSTVTCESCHAAATASVVTNQFGTYTASLKTLNSSVGHGQYPLAAQCTTCHDPASNHIGATDKRFYAGKAGNDLCNSCHTSGQGLPEARIDLPVHGGSTNSFPHYNSPADVADINTVRASECSGCHDTHGTSNNASIRTVINSVSVAAFTGASPVFVVTSAPYNGLCQVCHTKTKYYNNGVAPSGSHNTAANCLSCHKHKGNGVTWAFQPVGGDCGSCHGYPPVKSMAGLGILVNYSHAKLNDYTGGGGAHSVAGHIKKTAVQSEAWSNCTNCHISSSHATGGTPAKQEFVNVVVDPKFKFNNASTITYTGNTCSNVSCHFKPSPNWVTGN